MLHYVKDESDTFIPDGVQYERITVLLTKAVQDLKIELDKAKARIEELEGL